MGVRQRTATLVLAQPAPGQSKPVYQRGCHEDHTHRTRKKWVHETRITLIRWGTDAMGHVNNTGVLSLPGTCRIEWLHAIGCNPQG
jgi:hypothetical protein